MFWSGFPAIGRLGLVAGVLVGAGHARGDAQAVVELRSGPIRLSEVAAVGRGATPRGGRHVIQLDGALTPARREALEQRGVRLEAYLPRHAYVAALGEAAVRRIGELDFVSGVAAFRREWKIDPVLATLAVAHHGTVQTPAASAAVLAEYREAHGARRGALLDAGRVLVTVSTFRDTSPEEARAALSAVEGVEVVGAVRMGGRALVDVLVPLSALADVAAIPVVQFLEDAPHGTLRNATTAPVVQSGTDSATPVWDRGLHGEGQIIGLIDATPRLDHCMFSDTVAIGPSHRKIVAVRPDPPPSAHPHGTHVAGTAVGDAGIEGAYDAEDGIAFAVRLSYSDFFAVNSSPSTLLPRLMDAHADGARIHSNSWGDDSTSQYTVWSRIIDQFSHDEEDDLVVFAVTNGADLRSPENAKNVLAVGASLQFPTHNSHCLGGAGPTVDQRRKPDVYAPGCAVFSASSFASCGTRSDSGTSFACPAVAGSAALVRQYYVEGFHPTGTAVPADAWIPSGALMKATLLNATVDMTGVSGYPSDLEGWGRIVLDGALSFDGQSRRLVVRDVRNPDGLITGESVVFPVTILDGEESLNVTMVFTDPPAEVNASDPVINDLDLRVSGPSSGISGGAVFRGNYFKLGQSLAGGLADPRNNTEQVYLPSPSPGVYEIEVTAAAVNGLDPQGYAVVVSGNVLDGMFNLPESFSDHDADADTDLEDLAAYQICVGSESPLSPACAVFDANEDGGVDHADAAPLMLMVTGPEAPVGD